MANIPALLPPQAGSAPPSCYSSPHARVGELGQGMLCHGFLGRRTKRARAHCIQQEPVQAACLELPQQHDGDMQEGHQAEGREGCQCVWRPYEWGRRKKQSVKPNEAPSFPCQVSFHRRLFPTELSEQKYQLPVLSRTGGEVPTGGCGQLGASYQVVLPYSHCPWYPNSWFCCLLGFQNHQDSAQEAESKQRVAVIEWKLCHGWWEQCWRCTNLPPCICSELLHLAHGAPACLRRTELTGTRWQQECQHRAESPGILLHPNIPSYRAPIPTASTSHPPSPCRGDFLP